MAKSKDDFYLCVVGASAGGLDALTNLLNHLPDVKSNMAVIVAQHLSPTHKSRLVELLQKATSWPVSEAKQNRKLIAGQVYITPPDKDISINSNKLVLSKPSSSIGPKPSVNILFSSAAEAYKDKVIGIILSGSGSDGAIGVESIKLNNGITLVQDVKEAAYDGMPNAAIETGMVDATFSVKNVQDIFLDIFDHDFHPEIEESEESLTDFQKIYALLAKRTGVDFTDYKESTIRRRLESRINQLKMNSLNSYLSHIDKKPSEIETLFNHVLIGVTQFFRDPHAFEALKEQLRLLIESKTEKRIRIWSPGCATGEEPCSIAILLHELLGNSISEYDIQIFATDIDEVAIGKARKGVYPKEMVELLPPHYVSRYFRLRGNSYEVNKNIRSILLFSRHDVTTNPPFLKLDMITCRNMLIYFNLALQKRVIPIFHYALNPGGILFVGSSEALGTKENLFQIIDKKNKIFKRKQGVADRGLRFSSTSYKTPRIERQVKKEPVTLVDNIKNNFLDTYHQPFVVIDETQEILYIAGDIHKFLRFRSGPTTNNLFKMIEEEFEIDLRSTVSKAIKESEPKFSELKRIKRGNEYFLLRIVVRPLISLTDTFFVVIFENLPIAEDMVVLQQIPEDKQQSIRINELQHELNSTKEHLQSYIEELETTNEEMQSLNEELQSANEELQSSNEELETSNEELQSTNEEVQIAYQELKQLNEELSKKELALNQINKNMTAMVSNELQGFILIDDNFKLVEFNKRAQEILNAVNGIKLVKGRHFVDLLPSRLAHVFFHFIEFVKDGNPISTRFDIEQQDEVNESHLQLNFTPVYSTEHELQTSIGLLDISAVYKSQEKMKTLNAELKRSNEELTNFAYVASHDLQEPIRMITSFIDLLKDKIGQSLDEESTEYFDFITTSAVRLRRMVNDLLKYSRINTSAEELMETDLNDLIKQAEANLLSKIHESNAEVIVGELPKAKVIRSQFISVFQNLIDNAIKYKKPKTKPVIEISGRKVDGEITISVKDNGVGIPEKFADQVFVIFKRLVNKNESSGTGIGLSLAKRIVNRHGGTIWVQSDGKSGSTFRFTIPKKPSLTISES